MHILLTNDDGHHSPLFHLAIEILSAMGDLTIVAPKKEQSWTGKSITCFPPLQVDEAMIFNNPAFFVSGTPADCVNLGIYHLAETKPDLVVSGINAGVNTGLAFALSSGTIGACLEANIAGIPAVALSQDLDRDSFLRWNGEKQFQDHVMGRLQNQYHQLTGRIWSVLEESGDYLNSPVTWNVNLPFQAAQDCRIIRSIMGHTCYKSCFKRAGNHYLHAPESFNRDRRPHTDNAVIRQGHVSITRIDIWALGQKA